MLTKFPSIREQLLATGYFASLAKSVSCQCKPDFVEHCDRDGLFFTCELCLRDVPYCFGSGDDLFSTIAMTVLVRSKAMARFYPLEHEEWLEVSKELNLSELNVLYYIRTLDPYGKGIKVSANAIALKLGINRSTASRTLKSLDAKGYIDLEIVMANVSIKGKGLLHTRNK